MRKNYIKKCVLITALVVAVTGGALTGCGSSKSSSDETGTVSSDVSEDGWVYKNDDGVYAVHDTNPIDCNDIEFTYEPEQDMYVCGARLLETVQQMHYDIQVGRFTEAVDLMGDVDTFRHGKDSFEMEDTRIGDVVEVTNSEGSKVKIFKSSGKYLSSDREQRHIYVVSDKGLKLQLTLFEEDMDFTQEQLENFVVFSEGWDFK